MALKRSVLLALISIVMTPAFGQESAGKGTLSLGVGALMHSGDEPFVGKAMPSAVLAGEYFVARNLSLGVSAGYAHGKETGSFHFGNDFARMERKLTLVPMQAQVRFYPVTFGSAGQWAPYVTLAGGAVFAKYHVVGDNTSAAGGEKWAGVITPDVGMRFSPTGCRVFFDVRIGWQSYKGWSADTDKAQQNIGVHVGVGMPIF